MKENKVSVGEVTTGLRLILERVEYLGEKFLITKYGRAVARITPIKPRRLPKKNGQSA